MTRAFPRPYLKLSTNQLLDVQDYSPDEHGEMHFNLPEAH
jgi:hypothetical protein